MASPYVDFIEFVEFLALVVIDDDVGESQVHPRIAVSQFAIDTLAVFQFNENLLALDAGEHKER